MNSVKYEGYCDKFVMQSAFHLLSVTLDSVTVNTFYTTQVSLIVVQLCPGT